MNFKIVLHTIGTIMKVEAGLLFLPFVVSMVYQEKLYWPFLIPIVLLLVLGSLITLIKPDEKSIYAKEGLAIVGLSWIIMTLFGSLPFIISGAIPSIVDAIFETASGFTTTGASILTDIEAMSKGLLFWRSFTNWIGGMGVLIFILAIMPQTNARGIYMMKAESPGPTIGKLVSKVKVTARILYLIYIFLTIMEMILLSFQMPFFDSIVHAFATAGTGGFSIKNASIAFYNSPYIETVITIFMILFGVNFSIFYFALIGNFKQIFKSEEIKWYFSILIISMVVIGLNTVSLYESTAEAIRHSTFQVASIMTTTGFTSYDFNAWPTLSKTILVILMFIGASAGSTGGGIKVSRIVIYIKSVFREIKYSIHPRQVSAVKFEGKAVDDNIIKGVSTYMLAYLMIFVIAMLIISIEGKDLVTTFTSVVATFNNIGPGLEVVGPTGNYVSFTDLSKVTLSLTMIAGRLEIFPILVLFAPRLWRKN